MSSNVSYTKFKKFVSISETQLHQFFRNREHNMHDAIRCGNTDTVKFLLNKCLMNYCDDFHFEYACVCGYIEIVKLFLEKNPYYAENTLAFLHACQYGHLEIVQIFLNNKKCVKYL